MRNIRLLLSILVFLSSFSLMAQNITSDDSFTTKEEKKSTLSDSLTINETDKKKSNFYPVLSVGYHYQKQSFGEIGAGLLLPLDDTYDRFIFRVGAFAIMGATNSKFAVMPKVKADLLLNLRKEVYLSHAYYYMIGAETTTKSFAPYVGISIFGLLDLTGGYSFAYPKQTLYGKEMNGLRLGVTINIPSSIF